MRTKKFRWLPTKVYSVKYWRDGFVWFESAWLDADGKYYRTAS